MVRRDANGRLTDALFIDLDWCGVHGADRYVHEPNPRLGRGCYRPLAVERGAIMLQEHDKETLQACIEPLP
jgi:hypothetical protein